MLFLSATVLLLQGHGRPRRASTSEGAYNLVLISFVVVVVFGFLHAWLSRAARAYHHIPVNGRVLRTAAMILAGVQGSTPTAQTMTLEDFREAVHEDIVAALQPSSVERNCTKPPNAVRRGRRPKHQQQHSHHLHHHEGGHGHITEEHFVRTLFFGKYVQSRTPDCWSTFSSEYRPTLPPSLRCHPSQG